MATAKALDYLKVLLEGAVIEGAVAANAARSVSPPPTREKVPDWFIHAEVDALCAAVPHPADQMMTRLMYWAGLRWGEAAGLRVRDVDSDCRVVHVRRAMTQIVGVKEWPKTKSSVREVPIPGWLGEQIDTVAARRGDDALRFTTTG